MAIWSVVFKAIFFGNSTEGTQKGVPISEGKIEKVPIAKEFTYHEVHALLNMLYLKTKVTGRRNGKNS